MCGCSEAMNNLISDILDQTSNEATDAAVQQHAEHIRQTALRSKAGHFYARMKLNEQNQMEIYFKQGNVEAFEQYAVDTVKGYVPIEEWPVSQPDLSVIPDLVFNLEDAPRLAEYMEFYTSDEYPDPKERAYANLEAMNMEFANAGEQEHGTVVLLNEAVLGEFGPVENDELGVMVEDGLQDHPVVNTLQALGANVVVFG